MSEFPAVGEVQAVDVDVLSNAEDAPSQRLWAVVSVALAVIALALVLGADGVTRWLSALLGVGALAAVVYPRVTTDEALPRIPGVDLRSVPDIDPECIADHLVGPYDGPTRGLPTAEVVIARVDPHTSDVLKRVPAACARRWDKESLHTVLVAVPRAPSDVVQEVANAYDATLLVSDPADVPAMVAYLSDFLAQPEGNEITGIGSATVRRTPIGDRLPSDPGLREDVNSGRGKPLADVAGALRRNGQDETQPVVTMLSAPRDYLDGALTALKPTDSRALTVQHRAPRIDLVRLYLADEIPASVDDGWRRHSIREDSTDLSRRKPTLDCEMPDRGAPEADRSVASDY